MNIQAILSDLKQRFAPVSETAGLDAQVLAAHVLGRPRAWLLAHPEAELTPEQQGAIESAARRLEAGEALPYVLGRWEFYGLEFALTTGAVLIPRPETEHLVERALGWLRSHPNRRRCCDVGAGSGCIGVTLAFHIPDLRVVASDISPSALEVTRQNADRHGVAARVEAVHADLLPSEDARFDLICANLPYITTGSLRTLDVYAREPTLALDGGPDGLALIRRLLQQAPARISPGGLTLLEIEASQGQAVLELARAAFPSASIQVYPDLAGRDRVVEIQT